MSIHERDADAIRDLLLNYKVKIKFHKKDGTEREMNCTLNENLVVPYVKKTDNVRKSDPKIVPVFDLDKNEWRSFNVDSLIGVIEIQPI